MAAAHSPGFRHFGSWNFGLEFPKNPNFIHVILVGHGVPSLLVGGESQLTPQSHQNLHFCPSKKSQAPRRFFGGRKLLLENNSLVFQINHLSRYSNPQTPAEKAFRVSKYLLTRYLDHLDHFGRLGIGPKFSIQFWAKRSLHRAPATTKKTSLYSDFDNRKTP